MPSQFDFRFGSFHSRVVIQRKLPGITDFSGFLAAPACIALCDEHTGFLLERILGPQDRNRTLFTFVVPSGEENKSWNQVEAILGEARKYGLGRDGLFFAVGGGVLCDLAAFAASVYMRGAALALVPTTLLAMADAAIGGKTGFDLEGIKNFAGTFYPAAEVFIALEALKTLGEREWKSGMAEIIKTAVLDPDPAGLELLRAGDSDAPPPDKTPVKPDTRRMEALIAMSVAVKGAAVEADPAETGTGRALLNLGHTFGHALESAAGLGVLTHGEAVAWGMARSCELGTALGITPVARAALITEILAARGYHTGPIPPVPVFRNRFREALSNDKKKKDGRPRFVVPNAKTAEVVSWNAGVECYIRNLISTL